MKRDGKKPKNAISRLQLMIVTKKKNAKPNQPGANL